MTESEDIVLCSMGRKREHKLGKHESLSSSSSSSPSTPLSSSSDSLNSTPAKSRTPSSSAVSSPVSAGASVASLAVSVSPEQRRSKPSQPSPPPSPPLDVLSTTTSTPCSLLAMVDSACSSQSSNSSTSPQISAPPSTPIDENEFSLKSQGADDEQQAVGDFKLGGFAGDIIGNSLLPDSCQDDTVGQFLRHDVKSDERFLDKNPPPIMNAEKSNAPSKCEQNGEKKEIQGAASDIQTPLPPLGDSVDNTRSQAKVEQKKDVTKQADENGLDGLGHGNQQYGDAIVQAIVEDGLINSLLTTSPLSGFQYELNAEDGMAICTEVGEMHREDSTFFKGKTQTINHIDTKDIAAHDDGNMMRATASAPSLLILNGDKLQATSSAPSAVVLNKLAFKQSPVNRSHHHSELQQPEDSSKRGISIDYSSSGTPLVRSTTLPSESLSIIDGKDYMRKLPRSNTEKGKSRKNFESSNVRLIAAEKLSHRKKKKLMRNLGIIHKDGTVEFNLDESTRLVPDLFGTELIKPFDNLCDEDGRDKNVPPLQIVMLIVGTRGDVQPFIAIGKHLQEYGHRVRLATHANFREFVMSSGLEFYPLGGDPKVLAGYMVKNKGFLPSGPYEISIQRKQLKSIINSLLPACIEPDIESGVPFRAQAMIANPPAYGHVHVQEALGVPLHIFFTMPWTPTNEFPHPLARIKNPAGFRISYQVVDSIIWLGIKSLINDFRKKKLKLRPITYLSGTQGSISNLPIGYIWSPHLVPKPKDWGPRTDVVGFCFLNLASDYKPPEELVKWLQAGKAPIYVGFGSLPVEDPRRMMEIIIKALQKTEQRGIIVKGWGLTGDVSDPPDFVYLLENCPHDWLFPRCAAVVHHGGAGTIAAGLKAACPTTVVPFFGDQPFWGERVHLRGVGPQPIPVEHFSLEKLVAAIQFMLDPQVKQRAIDLAKCMEGEDGVVGAVNAFHKHLPNHIPECRPLKTSRQRGLFQIIRKMWSSS